MEPAMKGDWCWLSCRLSPQPPRPAVPRRSIVASGAVLLLGGVRPRFDFLPVFVLAVLVLHPILNEYMNQLES